MTSSGMKRGLAVSAISALAMTGLPLFASSASAETLNNSAGSATAVFLAAPNTHLSTKNDGQNTTVRLEALGGNSVAQMKFEYSLDGTNWNSITTLTSRNDNGAFAYEWTPTGLNGATGLRLRATGLASDGTTVVGTPAVSGASTVNNTDNSVNVNDGNAVGVFNAPNYTGTGATNQVIISGTSSSPSAAPTTQYWVADNGGTTHVPGFVGTSTTTSTTGSGALTGTWTSVMDITGYVYGASDELLVRATDTSDETESYNLYKQSISTVTATADKTQVQTGGHAVVTVTVKDQNGAPISGAEVRNSDQVVVGYSNYKGQVTANQGPGSEYYYANATASAPYEPELGDRKSDSITVTQYAPVSSSLAGHSTDGSAFDLNEYQALSDISVQLKDQNGNDLAQAGRTVSYHWVETPFDGSPATERTPLTGESTATTDAKGKAVIPMPAMPTDASGTYVLTAGLNADGLGNGAVAQSTVLTVKAGHASIKYTDGTPEQAAAGTSKSVTGKLVLEDGTGLAGRDVDATFHQGSESGPGHDAADANIVQADGSTASTRSYTTGSDGSFTVTVKDQAQNPQPNETGGYITAATGNITDGDGNTDNPGAPSSPAHQGVDFLTNLTPASVSIADHASQDTPGQIETRQITVMSGDTDSTTDGVQSVPLANQTVHVTLDHGYFTDATPAATPAAGDLVGNWTRKGKSIDVTTNGSGVATVKFSIGQDNEFNNDGMATSDLTATVGSASDTNTQDWNTAHPLNGKVVVSFAPQRFQDSTILPKASTSGSVAFDAKAEDQFGNPVGGERIDIANDNPNADVSYSQGTSHSYVVSDFDSAPDFYTTASQAGDQTVTGSWLTSKDVYNSSTPPADGGQTSNVATDSKTVNWYDIDYSKSTFSMTHSGGAAQAVGSTVTDTYTAKDQFGAPITNLYVKFFRTGPDNQQDGNGSFDGFTGTDGKIQYVFQGTQLGNATVTAVPREGSPTGTVVSQGQRSAGVTFKYAINALLSLANTKAGNDIARVNAPAAAHGAQIRLYKVMANGSRKWVATKTANSNGDASFVVADANKRGFTKYQAYVTSTARTFADWTLAHSIR